ncbi:MAG: TPMT family class I SAM-dependent methyltransferase [Bacteroidetes bacterium]|nr:TPMT family class I SAM-dependent methyltransferase [Bacteroidota bacterium]
MLTTIDKPFFWDEKYINDEANWDLKSPTPVWKELIVLGKLIHPCKLLVVGSGKGYDAIFAAKSGYEVTALDFSPNAISISKDLEKQEEVEMSFLQSDIFELDENYQESFDTVFDYVTFCAINIERRKEYLEIISSLIKPGGKFIILLFPTDERKGGPPFSVNEKEFYKETSKYLKLEYFSKNINSIKPRKGKEVLLIFRKP